MSSGRQVVQRGRTDMPTGVCVLSLMANGNQATLHLEVLRNASLIFLWPTCGIHSDGMHRCCRTARARIHPRTGHEVVEVDYRHSSTLSVTSALDWGVLSTPHPGRFTPGTETPHPLYRTLGGSQGRSELAWEISPSPPGFDLRTVQPEASLSRPMLQS
jgi:hypothetical protein